MIDGSFFMECLKYGIKYIPVTLKFALIVILISFVVGFIIGSIRYFKIPVLSQFLAFFVTLYLGLPLMVALNLYYMIYLLSFHDIGAFLGIEVTKADPLIVAYFAMILSTSCRMSEVFRGGYKAIEKIQFEAAYSVGMTCPQALTRVILPQMVPVLLPNMVNAVIGAIKGANLISAVGIMEIMNASIYLCYKNYSFVEGYLAAAAIYWIIILLVEKAGKALEKHTGSFRSQHI